MDSIQKPESQKLKGLHVVKTCRPRSVSQPVGCLREHHQSLSQQVEAVKPYPALSRKEPS